MASGDIQGASATTSNGKLAFDIETKGIWMYYLYDGFQYDDVHMEVVAENRGIANNVGLICRYSKDQGWYEFNVASTGLYKILFGRYGSNNTVIYGKLADGGSNKLKPGKDTNTIGITCKGRTLVLYINGAEVRRMDDNQYVLDKGQVGISVSSSKYVPVQVNVDSIKVSQP